MTKKCQGVGIRNPGSFRGQKRVELGEDVGFPKREPSLVFRGAERPASEIVYFLGRADLTEVYIGCHRSSTARKRMDQHNKESMKHGGARLELLVAVAGGTTQEALCQQYFADELIPDRGSRSLFKASSRLINYIRWLRDFYAAEVDPDTAVGVSMSSEWTPTEERQKPRPEYALPFDEKWADLLGPREVTADDYHTPRVVIEAARRAMGSITLDPASSHFANRDIRAERIWTASDKGEFQEWSGNVWLNPPFSCYATFASALERERPNYEQACVLVSERSLTTKYLAGVRKMASAICIANGRINFEGIVDAETGSATFGFIILYVGSRVDEFFGAFRHIGECFAK